MWALLLVLIVVLFVFNKTREHFGLVVGTKDIVTTNTKTNDGLEVFSTYPNTCPPDKPDLDAGLCYEKCRESFRGVGPVCWAITENIGVGRPIGLEPCPDGWSNDGLICREPIRCASGWDFFTKGCSGGRLRGRLNNGGICDYPEDRNKLPSWLRDMGMEEETTKSGKKKMVKKLVATHPDRVDGLCYRKCPKKLPKHVPGMPYLCYKGEGLAYGRGVGKVPSLVRVGRVWNPF
jgi:hypothetical protein